jgi:hypothetical protein
MLKQIIGYQTTEVNAFVNYSTPRRNIVLMLYINGLQINAGHCIWNTCRKCMLVHLFAELFSRREYRELWFSSATLRLPPTQRPKSKLISNPVCHPQRSGISSVRHSGESPNPGRFGPQSGYRLSPV